MDNNETTQNVAVSHGVWGEELAVAYLKHSGYRIVARNVRPCLWDKRLEIDIVAHNKKEDLLVFIEVKQHKTHSEYENRLRSISAHKKRLLRIACRAWLAKNHWHGPHRFDVIEVYGYPNMRDPAQIDHITHVRLFECEERFVNWTE